MVVRLLWSRMKNRIVLFYRYWSPTETREKIIDAMLMHGALRPQDGLRQCRFIVAI